MELVPLDASDADAASELLELQRTAYRAEADLIGSEAIQPLSETLEELQRCGETFLAARIGGALVGAISWRFDGETIDLHRLAVDPDRFRAGVGSALVRAALATEPAARSAVIQTGAGNAPAVALYLREGFEPSGESEPAPGLRVARFRKRLR